MITVSKSHSFIFFGEDVFSLAVLESLLNSPLNLQPLAVIVIEPVSVSGGRLLAFCEQQKIPLILTKSVRSEEFLLKFSDMRIDLMISAHFERLLPESLFKLAKLGALNLHPSLLPKYRGMSPQYWPIIYGDIETGVTVHLIDDGVDTGRIIHQVPIPINSSIYIHELQKKFLKVYQSVMVEAVRRVIAGEVGEPQPKMNSSYFHKIREEDMEIGADTDVEKAFNMVRAFSFPYVGARFRDKRIMKASRVDDPTWCLLKRTTNEIGYVDYQNHKYLLLKDGALEIAKWKYV